MSNEFVKLVKDFPGYREKIHTLHRQFSERSFIARGFFILRGTYRVNLKNRLIKLCREHKEEKQAAQEAAIKEQAKIQEDERQKRLQRDNAYRNLLSMIDQETSLSDARKEAFEETYKNPSESISIYFCR